MLSHNDVHYVTGFLHAVTHETVDQFTLGERVLDEASGSPRDVDIVFVAGDIGLAGVEVKDESLPLDVIVVEGLATKLRDMPSLQTRAIVSASGYTAPAREKARSHNVTCLDFVRDRIPTLSSIDISQLGELTVRDPVWSDGPHVQYLPTREISSAELDELRALLQGGSESFALRAITNQAIAATQEKTSGVADDVDVPTKYTFGLRHPLVVRLSKSEVTISNVAIRGSMRWHPKRVPLTDAAYLSDESGEPFAGTLLFEALDGLLAVGIAKETDSLSIYHIPDMARSRRPHSYEIRRNRA